MWGRSRSESREVLPRCAILRGNVAVTDLLSARDDAPPSQLATHASKGLSMSKQTRPNHIICLQCKSFRFLFVWGFQYQRIPGKIWKLKRTQKKINYFDLKNPIKNMNEQCLNLCIKYCNVFLKKKLILFLVININF